MQTINNATRTALQDHIHSSPSDTPTKMQPAQNVCRLIVLRRLADIVNIIRHPSIVRAPGVPQLQRSLRLLLLGIPVAGNVLYFL